jgi:competence protein ComEC
VAWWGIVLYGCSIAGLLRGGQKARAVWVIIAMTGFSISITQRPVENTRITVFDVGRGSAAAIEFPSGECWLWDCGSVSFRDPGRSILAPYLWARGQERIERIILTHSDLDHISGVPFLVRNFDVGEVVVPPQFGRGGERMLVEWLEAHHVPITRSRAGDEWIAPDGGQWRVVNPLPHAQVSDNDTSLAVEIQMNDLRVLLTGDMEEDGWATAQEQGLADRYDLLLVPHHGRPNALLLFDTR